MGASLLFGFLLVPLYVHAGAWNASIGPIGWLRLARWLPFDFAFEGKSAVVWIHGLGLIPWTTGLMTIGLLRVPTTLEQTAMLEGGMAQVLRRAWLPTLCRWAGLAWLWGATSVASDMLVTNLYRVQTLTELSYLQLTIGVSWSDGTSESWWMAWSCIPAILTGALATCLTWHRFRRAGSEQMRTDPPMFAEYAPRWGLVWSSLAWLTVVLVVFLPTLSLLGKAGWKAVPSGDEVQRRWGFDQVFQSMASLPDFSEEFYWSAQLSLLSASMAIIAGWILAGAVSSNRIAASTSVGLAILVAGLPGPIVNIGVKRSLESLPDRLGDLLLEESLAAPAMALQSRCLPLAFLAFFWLWVLWRKKHAAILRLEKPSWWSLQQNVASGMARPILAVWIVCIAISVADLATYLLVLPPQVSTLAMRIFELLHYGVRYKEAGLCLSLLVIGCSAGIATSRLLQVKRMDRL